MGMGGGSGGAARRRGGMPSTAGGSSEGMPPFTPGAAGAAALVERGGARLRTPTLHAQSSPPRASASRALIGGAGDCPPQRVVVGAGKDEDGVGGGEGGRRAKERISFGSVGGVPPPDTVQAVDGCPVLDIHKVTLNFLCKRSAPISLAHH